MLYLDFPWSSVFPDQQTDITAHIWKIACKNGLAIKIGSCKFAKYIPHASVGMLLQISANL